MKNRAKQPIKFSIFTASDWQYLIRYLCPDRCREGYNNKKSGLPF